MIDKNSLWNRLALERAASTAVEVARRGTASEFGRALRACRADRLRSTLLTRPETDRERQDKKEETRTDGQQRARDLAEVKRILATQDEIIADLRELPIGVLKGSLRYYQEERRHDLIRIAEVTTLSKGEFAEKHLTPAEARRYAES